MDSRKYLKGLLKKRPPDNNNIHHDRPIKRPPGRVNLHDYDGPEKIYRFRVLLPNGTSIGLTIRQSDAEMPVQNFFDLVKEEYTRQYTQIKSSKPKINWKSSNLCFLDAFDKKMINVVNFNDFEIKKLHILRLLDGSKEAETYENMWDLTPDTDLLKELPEEYTYETALADLIDNSLQAVWSNGRKGRKLICVEINKDRISIFDTGAGMDGSEENSIAKWGKMGASLHRSARGQAVGGTPPYLTPFFGMFGYGGPIASMHLGRRALVSSKMKESNKVYTLSLSREALLRSTGSEHIWKTDGGLRDPLEDEIQESPLGCFTKVEIFEPKMRSLDILQLQCRLKDIYFPYIQCDEVSSKGRTTTPIEFQVNGINLAEIDGGEVAITNLHSCNGPEFILQLHFKQDNAANSPRLRALLEANARIKCVYFPIVEGKESIERILEKLELEGCGIKESYESFSRVSIRRLGRLLPDARWAWLPFMEPRQRKGGRAHILKRCCSRVKCFIETDAGFNPTPSKTDLAHHHPFTSALKHLGSTPLDKDKDVHVEICKDGRQLTLSQLEKQYQDWVLQMHDTYDQEIDGGEDQPLLIVGPSNKKKLGISSDVVRVHKVLRRKGKIWKSQQPVKVLKGACAGCHKNNVYAILECFLLEGFQGDACGEARIICRPLSVLEENGCLLSTDKENPTIDIRGSMSLPISVIDSGKCLMIESADWNQQAERQRMKGQCSIDLLSPEHCRQLEFEGTLPVDAVVSAGHVPPKEIVAVLRPTSSNSSAWKNLDQKYILKDNRDMCLEIKFGAGERNREDENHIYSRRISPSSHKGYNGLYIFPLSCKLQLFQKSGFYTFYLSIKDSNCTDLVETVQVNPLSEIREWGLLSYEKSQQSVVRVGSLFPPVSIVGYDEYKNQIPFSCVPELMVKISSDKGVLGHAKKMDVHLSADKSILNVKNLLIESRQLDNIRPSYEATLIISSQDELLSVSIPFQVIPGPLYHVKSQPINFEKLLIPGHVFKEFVLEMYDPYGNHLKADSSIVLEVDGFSLLDKASSIRKVDDQGCVDLSGLLKVIKGYGESVSFSVVSDKKPIFKKRFQTERRELRLASEIPMDCEAGSQLENIEFTIMNTEGDIDESIHDDETGGQSHTLIIKSKSMDIDDFIRYSFRRGRCTVRYISVPQEQGIFDFVAAHSRHPELNLTIEVHVVQRPSVEPGYMQYQSPDRNMVVLQDSPAFRTPKVETETYDNDDVLCQQFLLPHSSAPTDVRTLVNSFMSKKQELLDEIRQYGKSICKHEEKLKNLNLEKVAIEQDLYKLQVSMDVNYSRCGTDHTTSEKEAVMKKIESKGESAAAVVCRLSKEIQLEEHNNLFKNSVLGVVALLGAVQNNKLSRMLANYLREDQMLAVVCKSYAAAGALERYDDLNGEVVPTRGLHALATELGKSINGRYTVICLEDISPYSGEVRSDSQRTLALSDPVLPNGKMPSGFVGYAVNMIYLDDHIYSRTTSGHGLRETLFYRLFGELQVYETREHMKIAYPCIKDGAVSLDGGIFRGNGIISLGTWEPAVLFPVVNVERQLSTYSECGAALAMVQDKKNQVRDKVEEIEREIKIHEKDVNSLRKKMNECKMFLDILTPSPPTLNIVPARTRLPD